MERRRQILEPVTFLIFCAVAIWLIGIFKQGLLYYQLLPLQIFECVLFFILGILLNCVNRKINLHARRFSLYHLIVVLVCVLFVVACYTLYMPQFIYNNLVVIELILLSYAGANLPSVFFE